MIVKANWGFMVLLAASSFVGCAQTQPTIRGQSPAVASPAAPATAPAEYPGPIIGTAPGYSEQIVHPYKRALTHQDFQLYHGFRDNNFGYEGGYYAGPQGYYTDKGRHYVANNGGCPACEYGRGCPQGGCPHCGCNNGCGYGGCPYNYQTYSYKWPQNMVYPPDQVPAGMVQYPYYTLRGPTDFFMK